MRSLQEAKWHYRTLTMKLELNKSMRELHKRKMNSRDPVWWIHKVRTRAMHELTRGWASWRLSTVCQFGEHVDRAYIFVFFFSNRFKWRNWVKKDIHCNLLLCLNLWIVCCSFFRCCFRLKELFSENVKSNWRWERSWSEDYPLKKFLFCFLCTLSKKIEPQKFISYQK